MPSRTAALDRPTSPLRPAITAALAGLVVLVLTACGQSEPAGPPNLLLITIDTLRFDRLAHAGHTRATTPVIDELAEQSIVFENAYSMSGWTLPSMASIMTGRYPRAHGATDFHLRIDRRLPTLASLLRRNGYDTRAVVSHILLKPKFGFGKGFVHYDTAALELGRPKDVSTAALITDHAISWVPVLEPPFFLWVHYFDPHNEYMPHAEFGDFGDSPADLYDQEVAHTDQQIGRLLDALREAGLLENTLIALTADHGEEFGDHDGEYHYTLHEEVVRIPLLIRVPGVAPRVEKPTAQQIDLVPTLLAALGLESPARVAGRDLLASTDEAPQIFIERDRPAGFKQRAAIAGGKKLVVIERVETDSLPNVSRHNFSEIRNVEEGVFFFDLEADPLERAPIDPKGLADASTLLEALAQHFEDLPAGAAEAVDLDDATEEQLRSLGYLR